MVILGGLGVAAVAVIVVVAVVVAVLWLPRHFVLLFEPATGVGEPSGHLGQRHLGDDGQHDLLTFGRVRVLLVLRQPGLERRRRLAGGVFPPRSVQIHSVPAGNKPKNLKI